MNAKVLVQLLGENAIGRVYQYSDLSGSECFVRIVRLCPDNEVSETVCIAEYLSGFASGWIIEAEDEPYDETPCFDHGTFKDAHWDGDHWVVTFPHPVQVRPSFTPSPLSFAI